MRYWFIDDFDEITIYITDLWTEAYLPKFQLDLKVDEPYLTIAWNDEQKGPGGEQREIKIDYRDVVDGYVGYVSNPSSAADLRLLIKALTVSAWASSGGDILTAKADLLSHDGVSDTILPGGANEAVLVRDNTQATGLNWVAKSNIVDGGLSVTDTDTLALTKAGALISARVLKETFHICAIMSWNPVDASLVFFNGTGNVVNTGIATFKNIIPPACTIIGVDMTWHTTSGVAGSNEAIPLNLRKNDTTDTLIASIADTNIIKRFTNLALNITMNGTTDFYCFKIQCPTWATNPGAVGFQGTVYYKLT